MGIEIERKFLTTSDAWRQAAHRVVEMAQGYLNDSESVVAGRQNASVRVRLEGEDARLNIKSREMGASRQEFDYPIPVEDARALVALCVGGTVLKRRYFVHHAGHEWEIDEFLGDNAGLVVAEVELDAEDEAFAMPDWAGREVTHLPRYYNLNLVAHPFSKWNDEARHPA
ncbi:CYTH domain-containing protein [Lysobacter pythonis]|uniref:CYTH domain-containing protein n=1 Tax=Solilutibacter pythonis TaxID=2483112 RepID=A0A3M2HXU6_9GAMM|nr:CYTH domain-containing protein [Lysobacter pythonis]RMH94551.1 CYTH domain-containing protein [Lysobacter pythonis]